MRWAASEAQRTWEQEKRALIEASYRRPWSARLGCGLYRGRNEEALPKGRCACGLTTRGDASWMTREDLLVIF